MHRVVLKLAVLACLTPSVSAAADVEFGNKYLFGDIHVHTGKGSGDACASDAGPSWNQSSSCGAWADLDDVAIANGLDFMFLTDHVNGKGDSSGSNGHTIKDADGGDTAWRDICDQAFTWSTSSFLAFCGAEVFFTKSDGTEYGHKNLVFFGTESALSGLTRNDVSPTGSNANSMGTTDSSDVANCGAIDTWADGLAASYGDLLLIPHHPAATTPMPTLWSCHTPDYEVGVEVWGKHGSSRIRLSSETPPGDDHDPLLTQSGGSNTKNTGTYAYEKNTYYTDPNYDMAVLGGGDYHETRAGHVCQNSGEPTPSHKYGGALTVLVVDDNDTMTRDLIHDTIVAGHTYATTGPLVPVKMTVLNGSTELGTMGDSFDLSSATNLTFKAEVPASGSPTWEDDVAAAYVVKKGSCTTGPGATCSESRTSMTETSAGVWEATVSMSADADANNDDFAYILLELDGTDAHPTGCIDGGADAIERIMTTDVHTY